MLTSRDRGNLTKNTDKWEDVMPECEERVTVGQRKLALKCKTNAITSMR
jgi:hypothetical protein